MTRKVQDCGKEEDKKDHGADYRDEECKKECSGEDGCGKANRTKTRRTVRRRRITIANRPAGTPFAVDVVVIAEKKGWSWR